MTAAPPILSGSIADLAARAAGRPIYCTGQFGLHPELIRCNLAWLRRQASAAEFIPARGLYADLDEWRARWSRERTLYGGAIVMTVGEDVPEADHPLATRFGGRHEIGAAVMTGNHRVLLPECGARSAGCVLSGRKPSGSAGLLSRRWI